MSATLNLEVILMATPLSFLTPLNRNSSIHTSPLIHSSEIFLIPTIKNLILDNAGFPFILICFPVGNPSSL